MTQERDLTVILCLDEPKATTSIERYRSAGRQLIMICGDDPTAFDPDFSVISYDRSIGKVAAMNAAILQAKRSHILWIEEGESVPDIPVLAENTYYTARITNMKAENRVQNRQVRLFPNLSSMAIDGFAIPELHATALRLGWQESEHELSMQRPGALFPVDDIIREVEQGAEASGRVHFWQGLLAMERESFTQAIKYLKAAVSEEKLSRWNKLAALNSLANIYVETHQLEQAKRTAEQSLEQSLNQRAPYLTLYQVYNFQGKADKAYETLARYHQSATADTAANWDVYLPQAQAAFLMAEIAIKQGRHQKAYRHYQQFYVFNNGQVGDEILEKLFLYAVELQDREKAIHYFEALFSGCIAENNNTDNAARIREALSLFMDKGWYDYASKIYRKMIEGRPNDEALRNGLIRTLVKNDEIAKAQALL